MKKRLFFLLFFLVSLCSADYTQPLNEQWSQPLQSGGIYLIDLDKDGLLEVYVASYVEDGACITVFNYKGKPLRDDCLPKYSRGRYSAASEGMDFIYLEDMKNDAILDVVAAAWIRGGSVNIRKIYLIQRVFEYGFNRYDYDLQWEYAAGNTITDVIVDDVDLDGFSEIIMSSLDGCVYVLQHNGRELYRIELLDGVWSVESAGSGVFFCGFPSSVSLLDFGGAIWTYPTSGRVIDLCSSDVDADNSSEVVAVSSDVAYFLDSDGSLLWAHAGEKLIKCEIKDVDNDGELDVLLLSEDSLSSYRLDGSLQWKSVFDEKLLSLTIDFYNNIFVGSNERVHHLVVNQAYLLNIRAEEAYKTAYDFYLANDFPRARFYASQAKQLFEFAGNAGGSLRADYIFIVTENESSAIDARSEAASYFSQASDLFAAGSFEEALLSAEMALNLYRGISDKNSAIECDVLIFKINKALREKKLGEANVFYSSAVSALYSGFFEGAYSNASQALDVFQGLNDSVGIKKSESLLADVRKAEKLYSADSSYNRSLESFDSEEYDEALLYAEKARVEYLGLNRSDEIVSCDLLIVKSARYGEAKAFYDLGREKLAESSFDEAASYVLLAREVYLEFDDSSRVKLCDSMLSEIEDRKRGAFLNYVFILAGVLLLLGAAVFYWKRRG